MSSGVSSLWSFPAFEMKQVEQNHDPQSSTPALWSSVAAPQPEQTSFFWAIVGSLTYQMSRRFIGSFEVDSFFYSFFRPFEASRVAIWSLWNSRLAFLALSKESIVDWKLAFRRSILVRFFTGSGFFGFRFTEFPFFLFQFFFQLRDPTR